MDNIVTEAFGVTASEGLYLRSARLWVDGKPRKERAFIGDLRGRPARAERIVCSAQMAAMWGYSSAGPKARTARKMPLAAPYRERFKLGERNFELLPAGSAPGAALLAVESDGRDLLFAGAARLDALPGADPIPDFAADVLFVDARFGHVEHASVAQLRAEVDDALHRLLDGTRGHVWLFDDPVVALAVALLVGRRAPLYGTLGFKRWSWRFGDADVHTPRIRRLGGHGQPASFVLWPIRRVLELHGRDLDDFQWTLCAESADHAMADQVGAERFIPMSRHSSGTDLDRLVHALQPADVVAYGNGAAALCARLNDPANYAGSDAQPPKTWHLDGDRQLRLWA